MRSAVLPSVAVVIVVASLIASAQTKVPPTVPTLRNVPEAPVNPVRSSGVIPVSAQTSEEFPNRVHHPEEVRVQLRLLADEFGAAGMIEEARLLARLQQSVDDPKMQAAYRKAIGKQIRLKFRIMELAESTDIKQLFPNVTSSAAENGRSLSGIFAPDKLDKWIAEMEKQGQLRVCYQDQATILNGRTTRLTSSQGPVAPMDLQDKTTAPVQMPGAGLVVSALSETDSRTNLRIKAEQWQAQGQQPGQIEIDTDIPKGQSLALIGMRTFGNRVEVSRIPVLGDVPGVGPMLFSSKKTTVEVHELMFVLTPEVTAAAPTGASAVQPAGFVAPSR